MKIGDLVKWNDDIVVEWKEDVGIIIGFDWEADPVVLWQIMGLSNTSEVGEYRDHVEVVR